MSTHRRSALLVALSLLAVACVIQSQPTTTTVEPEATTTTAPTTTTGDQSTTTAPTATTTTTRPVTRCLPDPFVDLDVGALTAGYPNALIHAHVYDTRNGCHYELNPEVRTRTASVFKIMVMAGTLLEAQTADRQVTEWEMGQLIPMITESANGPVGRLWRQFGASPWYREQGEIFGLTETVIRADSGSAWGGTRTSASDQVDLIRQVLLGEWGPLEEGYRRVALDLMMSVVPSQSWGISAGVPAGWTVALKNGFAGTTINSVGWVDEPGPSRGYVVAILSHGWPNHPRGIAAVEVVNRAIVRSLIGPSTLGPR